MTFTKGEIVVVSHPTHQFYGMTGVIEKTTYNSVLVKVDNLKIGHSGSTTDLTRKDFWFFDPRHLMLVMQEFVDYEDML